MSTKLLLMAVSAFLCVSQFANAGVMLYVHFGDNAPDFTTNEHDLQTTFDPGADTLTANYYLRLTDGSTIYAYRFSVLFNDKLEFVSVVQTQPSPLIANPSLAAPSAALGTHVLNRFNGADPSVLTTDPLPPNLLAGDGFHKLASTTFRLKVPGSTFSPGEVIVKPGQFELAPKTDLSDPDVLVDIFNSDDAGMAAFFPGVTGGTVSNSSVPEPASVFVLGALGVLVLARRNRRIQSRVPRAQ